MSGIVGSYHNIRGSGVVAKLGTDGQVFTSAGAGLKQTFEAAPGGGKIGQVLQSMKLAPEAFSSSGSAQDISDLTIDITPSATDSKILIMSSISGYSQGGSMAFTIQSDSTGSFINIGMSAETSRDNQSFSGNLYTGDAAGTSQMHYNMVATYLHSPGVTSAVTYKIVVVAENTLYINKKEGDTTNEDVGVSHITVMEVLA